MKTTTKLLLALSLALALLTGLGPAPADAGFIDPGGACNCPDVYAPVLGANGVCYSNSCQASCAGQPVVGLCGVDIF